MGRRGSRIDGGREVEFWRGGRVEVGERRRRGNLQGVAHRGGRRDGRRAAGLTAEGGERADLAVVAAAAVAAEGSRTWQKAVVEDPSSEERGPAGLPAH